MARRRSRDGQPVKEINTYVLQSTYDQIVDAVKNSSDEFGINKYVNISHFVEVAILRLLRSEGYGDGKRKRGYEEEA